MKTVGPDELESGADAGGLEYETCADERGVEIGMDETGGPEKADAKLLTDDAAPGLGRGTEEFTGGTLDAETLGRLCEEMLSETPGREALVDTDAV